MEFKVLKEVDMMVNGKMDYVMEEALFIGFQEVNMKVIGKMI